MGKKTSGAVAELNEQDDEMQTFFAVFFAKLKEEETLSMCAGSSRKQECVKVHL